MGLPYFRKITGRSIIPNDLQEYTLTPNSGIRFLAAKPDLNFSSFEVLEADHWTSFTQDAFRLLFHQLFITDQLKIEKRKVSKRYLGFIPVGSVAYGIRLEPGGLTLHP
ncbi:MAG: hypothetical protein AAGG75_07075 [Bacteroidota bacterium]